MLQGCGVEVPAEVAERIWRRLRKVQYGLAPFDDSIPTLDALRERGLTVGMISNIDQPGDQIAENVGLAEHLDLVVTSWEVGLEKPNPEIFWAALERAGAEPGDAMHVGDQPASDVAGAVRAGHSACAAGPRRRPPGLQPLPSD